MSKSAGETPREYAHSLPPRKMPGFDGSVVSRKVGRHREGQPKDAPAASSEVTGEQIAG
jgi:hypothetical protein